jgi:alpha-L-rhamnosidase
MKPTELRCEYLVNPIGIDVVNPRLLWKFDLEQGIYGAAQTAYQIHASSTLEQLENGCLLWDSQKVESDESIHILYGGVQPKSRERIYWKIKVWDENQKEGEWSEPAYFEMGLLKDSDWSAKWVNPEKEIDKNMQQPASYLRKEFNLHENVQKARLYITSYGVYEAWLNGKRIQDQILTPGVTSYDKRLQYQTYDVANQLVKGKNAIGAILGDGWYRGSLGNAGNRNVYGKHILLLAQLEIEFTTGDHLVISTDENWRATQEGPIRLSDLQDGEIYDAQKEHIEWSVAGFPDEKWNRVTLVKNDYQNLVGISSIPIREHEHFTPKVLYTPDGNTVLDFGQNMAGYVQFNVKGKKGHRVTLIHGEALDQYGNFTMEHLNNTSRPKKNPLKQEINYYLKGGELESYKPHFTIHGFRYVLLVNWPEAVCSNNFTAIAVYSDMVQTGKFECSNPLMNQLVSNTRWSQKSNFVDIPTDCPQRERAAWTGDAQVFVRTGSTLMDTAAFYRKWMKDVALQQKENGMIRNIAPKISDGSDKAMETIEGSAGWGDAAVIIPWTMYQVYGDKRILEEQWESMKAWVDYEAKCAKKTHFSRIFKRNPYRKYTWDTRFHWGEWAEPASKDHPKEDLMKNVLFSVPEVATAYFAYSSNLLSQCANILGKKEEAHYYRELSQKVRLAYLYNFTKEGTIESSRQCLYVRPLALGLLPREKRQEAANKLHELIVERDYHIGTGFLSTPFICKVLCDYGHVEAAYKLVEQTSMPSWLYPITKGATTIWEQWDGINVENVVRESLNHYSAGAVAGWFFQYVAGIDLEEDSIGYKQFIIAPKPGGTLTKARGIYHSINGKIVSEWQKTDTCFILKVEIPPNTIARVILPCNDISKVKVIKGKADTMVYTMEQSCVSTKLPSGEYHFSFF